MAEEQLNLGIYSAGKFNMKVNNRTLQGVDENDFFETERDEAEEFKTKVGAKGDFTFVENMNKAGAFIVRLKQNSPDNVYLQSLKDAKAIFPTEISGNGAYKEKAYGQFCMIGTAPRKKIGKDENMREWRIVTGFLQETDRSL